MQKAFAALDAENRMLANPSSIDFFPLAGNIEDHSTNAPLVVDKVSKIVDNLRYIIGMEAMHSAQAIDLRKNVKLGEGTKIAYDLIRSTIKFLEDDRNLSIDIKKSYDLIKSGRFIEELDKIE
jgi:histidine ammonia-lyase